MKCVIDMTISVIFLNYSDGDEEDDDVDYSDNDGDYHFNNLLVLLLS